ncbi:MAG: ribonuclease H-like domain-containing protein [Candidatus Woesearchaeota archaeon]
MLQNTFIHIPKITVNNEKQLWNNSIHTWQDFVDRKDKISISESKRLLLTNALNDSINALNEKRFNYFCGIPSNQHWRMYTALKNNVCFLDIETTGLSKQNNDITLIGIHSENNTKIFMNGKNLEKFDNELKKYDMIITFNGKCFDIPFIKQKFANAKIPIFHADLRFVMADLGFRGGLKSIEIQKGIKRDEELDGVDGFEAVRLWHKYQRGDNDSLVTLKKYLTADVENLKILMDQAAIDMKKKHYYDIIENR